MNFVAEPINELVDRLHDALIDEYTSKDAEDLPLPEGREHIFDFKDNLRLVITRNQDTFHVVATPAGGPVFKNASYKGIAKEVIDRVAKIGLMDIIGLADTKVEFICGGHLHLIIKPGSGRFEVESKCGAFPSEKFTTTLGSGYSNE